MEILLTILQFLIDYKLLGVSFALGIIILIVAVLIRWKLDISGETNLTDKTRTNQSSADAQPKRKFASQLFF